MHKLHSLNPQTSKMDEKIRLTRESTLEKMIILVDIIIIIVVEVVVINIIGIIVSVMRAREENVVVEVVGIGRDHVIVMTTTTVLGSK